MLKNIKILFFSLLILVLGCEDFLSGPLLDQNPNEVDDVSVVSPEALLVGFYLGDAIRKREGTVIGFPLDDLYYGILLVEYTARVSIPRPLGHPKAFTGPPPYPEVPSHRRARDRPRDGSQDAAHHSA